jgi:hypothetical protein
MPFLVNMECACCRDGLWHCQKCWERFHNLGPLGAGDYVSPDFYGQSMFSIEMVNGSRRMAELEIEFESTIKEDKKREYKEGCYGH